MVNMAKPRTKEYRAFEDALGKVLSVSHGEMKAMLEQEKREKPQAAVPKKRSLRSK